MWWIFGKKKKSKYDDIMGASEEADFLFRTQAGITADEERRNAEKDEAYEKEFHRGIRNHRSREEAHQAALNKKTNLRTKKKPIISSSDEDKFNNTIRSVSYDTYKELIERRDRAAEDLVNYYNDLSMHSKNSVHKTAFDAANSDAGRNFKLYNSIIQNIEYEHYGDPEFTRWKKSLENADVKNGTGSEKTQMFAIRSLISENMTVKINICEPTKV